MPGPETKFERETMKEIEKELPGCYTTKGNSARRQGVPDRVILYGDRWAMLEFKKHKPAPSDFEPNQEYYIDQFNNMSFAACIYPENKEEVLDAVYKALRP